MRLWLLAFLVSFVWAEGTAFLKVPLSKSQLDKKEEGGYFAFFPLANYDTDNGYGYGARAYWYENGTKDNKYFPYAPYKHRFYAHALLSTKGRANYILNYDGPYYYESMVRLGLDVAYEHNTNGYYFGNGALEQSSAVDLTKQSAGYYRYAFDKPTITTSLYHDVFDGLGKIYTKVHLRNNTIKAYDSTKLALDASFDNTLLRSGNVVALTLGGMYDTRDSENNPTRGEFHELSFMGAPKALGSDFEYTQTVLRTRWYYSIFDDSLTLALQSLYVMQLGDVPFYEMSSLGGRVSLRGYALNRYVAKNKFQNNLEFRFHSYYDTLLGSSFEAMVVPFVDFGKVYDTPMIDFVDYKSTAGVGFKMIWKQTLVGYFDAGFGAEDWSTYINFGYIFDSDI